MTMEAHLATGCKLLCSQVTASTSPQCSQPSQQVIIKIRQYEIPRSDGKKAKFTGIVIKGSAFALGQFPHINLKDLQKKIDGRKDDIVLTLLISRGNDYSKLPHVQIPLTA